MLIVPDQANLFDYWYNSQLHCCTTNAPAIIQNLNERIAIGYEQDIIDRSVAYGKSVATSVFEYSKTDGGHQGYSKNFPSDYVVPQGAGKWIPTGPAYQKIPMQPYWGNNRSFVLTVGDPLRDCDPGKPIDFSTQPGSAFYTEAIDVYTTVKNVSSSQKEIALFWSDDPVKTATPPASGCWCRQ